MCNKNSYPLRIFFKDLGDVDANNKFSITQRKQIKLTETEFINSFFTTKPNTKKL